MRVAIATCVEPPEADPDEDLLLDALRLRGVDARMVAWDGPSPVGADELCVVRSTWNYYRHLEAFLAWTARVPRLLNSAKVIRGNVVKTYLRALGDAGIPIVPTAWGVEGSGPHDVASTMDERGWDCVVVKPVVSAGSFATKRFDRSQASEASAFLASTGREMMVQRWMPAVDTSGERSLVWLDGSVSHAIRKSPRFAGHAEAVTPAEIADDERAFAERVILAWAETAKASPADLLYARVDVIRDGDTLRLMELELVEPSLFLRQSPPGLARFADAIVARI